RLALDARHNAGDEPARQAQFDNGDQRAVRIEAARGSAQIVHLLHGALHRFTSATMDAISSPPPHSISLGGLRTPAPECVAPSSWGRHPKTFTTADMTPSGLGNLNSCSPSQCALGSSPNKSGQPTEPFWHNRVRWGGQPSRLVQPKSAILVLFYDQAQRI